MLSFAQAVGHFALKILHPVAVCYYTALQQLVKDLLFGSLISLYSAFKTISMCK